MFSCGKRREQRGEDLYTSVHAMAIRSTVVDMEPTKHVPLQRPQQQQRKHSVFDGEILKSELKSIGVKPLHVLTIWTWAFSHPLCPSFFAFSVVLNSFSVSAICKGKISLSFDLSLFACKNRAVSGRAFMPSCTMAGDWRDRKSCTSRLLEEPLC